MDFDVDTIEEQFFDNKDEGKKYPSSKRKLKRKEKALAKAEQPVSEIFKLKPVSPLTKVQRQFFESYCSAEHLVGHGSAGTGKSYLSIYLAMQDVLNGVYDKLIIIRSPLESIKIGFLPGTDKEKVEVYEKPYHSIFADLFGKDNAYEMLKKRGLVEFEPTAFLRGTTFNNCVIVYDEFQNGTWMESNTVLTRMGENSKMVIVGDYRQSDHKNSHDKRAALKLMRILKSMNATIDFIEFTSKDIVRSKFVKDFIMACERDEDQYPDGSHPE